MSSVVCTGHEYLLRGQQLEAKGNFRYRLLAEGDSWMDRSSLVIPSLPWFLADEMDRRGVPVIIINLSIAGSELRHITDAMKGELMWWLRQFKYDAILFSASGNDFIDAARDPAPGQGLLRDMAGQPVPLPADGYGCVSQPALGLLRNFLDVNFRQLVAAMRAQGLNQSTPLYLNSYDTPTARPAPAGPGMGPWLFEAYEKNHIDPVCWESLTEGIFRDVAQVIQGWGQVDTGIEVVPTMGVLDRAVVGSSGSSGDWANEIHPNAGGWAKLAKVWADQLQADLP